MFAEDCVESNYSVLYIVLVRYWGIRKSRALVSIIYAYTGERSVFVAFVYYELQRHLIVCESNDKVVLLEMLCPKHLSLRGIASEVTLLFVCYFKTWDALTLLSPYPDCAYLHEFFSHNKLLCRLHSSIVRALRNHCLQRCGHSSRQGCNRCLP